MSAVPQPHLDALYATIDALPPLSDEQLDAIADVLAEVPLPRAGRTDA